MPVTQETLDKLSAPFPTGMIQFRAGRSSRAGTSCQALAYIDARTVQERLDTVLGPANWTAVFHWEEVGGTVMCVCTLAVYIAHEDGDSSWVEKQDGAGSTNFEAVKGGMSDALKRAAVQWGIGRSLYFLPVHWVRASRRGKSTTLEEIPNIPTWYREGHMCDPSKLNDAPSTEDRTDFTPVDRPETVAQPGGNANFEGAAQGLVGHLPEPVPQAELPAGFPAGINPSAAIGFGKKVMPSGRSIREYTWGEIVALEPDDDARSYVEWMAKVAVEKRGDCAPAMNQAKMMVDWMTAQDAAAAHATMAKMEEKEQHPEQGYPEDPFDDGGVPF